MANKCKCGHNASLIQKAKQEWENAQLIAAQIPHNRFAREKAAEAATLYRKLRSMR